MPIFKFPSTFLTHSSTLLSISPLQNLITVHLHLPVLCNFLIPLHISFYLRYPVVPVAFDSVLILISFISVPEFTIYKNNCFSFYKGYIRLSWQLFIVFNLYPLCHRAFLRSTSDFVSLYLMAFIFFLLCSGVRLSIFFLLQISQSINSFSFFINI